mgnify:CR=1 FL=1
MIQLRTMLKVADNSGAKIIQCIKILIGTKHRYGKIGDIIVGVVKVAEPRRLVKKHEVIKAVIVRQKKSLRRKLLIVNDSGFPFLAPIGYKDWHMYKTTWGPLRIISKKEGIKVSKIR